MEQADIFCPRCGWRPGPGDRWVCKPQCGTLFNTFWTRGMCPGCTHQWHLTQCFACREHSPHAAWYHQRPKQKVVRRRRVPVENL